jgi:hypothetical protein
MITNDELQEIAAKLIKEKYSYGAHDDAGEQIGGEVIRLASQVAADLIYEYHLRVSATK